MENLKFHIVITPTLTSPIKGKEKKLGFRMRTK